MVDAGDYCDITAANLVSDLEMEGGSYVYYAGGCGYVTKDVGEDPGHAEPYEEDDEGEDEEGHAEEREE